MCLALGGCAGLRGGQLQDFNGRWIVDMAASLAINPSLSQREDIRQFMSKVIMAIDMDRREMSIIFEGMEERRRGIPFTITEHQPGRIVLTMKDDVDIVFIDLQLKNNQLIFITPDQPGQREDFVFVRKP